METLNNQRHLVFRRKWGKKGMIRGVSLSTIRKKEEFTPYAKFSKLQTLTVEESADPQILREGSQPTSLGTARCNTRPSAPMANSEPSKATEDILTKRIADHSHSNNVAPPGSIWSCSFDAAFSETHRILEGASWDPRVRLIMFSMFSEILKTSVG
jgi:hypothetical protein